MFEQATNVAVPPTFLFSLVGFLVMLRKVGFAGSGVGAGIGAGTGTGTGAVLGIGVAAGAGVTAGSSSAAGLGTGINSVGAFVPVNTA